jgi:hypothetical protein
MIGCNVAMAPSLRKPRISLITIKTLVILFIPSLAVAWAESDSVYAQAPPTHRQFVDSCLTSLAGQLLSDFTPNRSQPIVVVADTAGDPAGTIARFLTKAISERGLLVRETEPDSSLADAGSWSLYYNTTARELALTEPHRRTFLGRIWVKRSVRAGLRMRVRDDREGTDIWADWKDSVCDDWVAKRDLKSLESEGFDPVAPLTGWEKAKMPLIIGGTALVVGVLFLTLGA